MSDVEVGRKPRNIRHGHAGNTSMTPVYRVWRSMRARCNNPNHKAYSSYGGRGISVCARWGLFENFLADMGEPAKGASLDRINNNAGYSPENCRWATRAEQSRNQRTTKLTIEKARAIRADARTLKDIADYYGVSLTHVCAIKQNRKWKE